MLLITQINCSGQEDKSAKKFDSIDSVFFIFNISDYSKRHLNCINFENIVLNLCAVTISTTSIFILIRAHRVSKELMQEISCATLLRRGAEFSKMYLSINFRDNRQGY